MGIEPLVVEAGIRFSVERSSSPIVGGGTGLRGLCRMATTVSSEEVVKAKQISHVRRDRLLDIEEGVRKRWNDVKLFEAEAMDQLPKEGEKFFGNFPYPYMNGVLHLGHAFSLSKLEFAAAYRRLCGSKVLLPMGFHCTGMPIKACADKIAREIEEFGNPPVFPVDDDNQAPAETTTQSESDPSKFRGSKSKAVAKKISSKYQWMIMKSMGISDEDIPKFKDPLYWLEYFPPIAMKDLKLFGLSCDWRRSFITTEMNPYYDSFVKWQFECLRRKGKVVKDLRCSVYSPLDGQPCADHDRSIGEGVQAQEYVLIKMKVKPPFSGELKALEGKNVYLAAATLRPETMYGQTNAWVLAEGDYGAYEVNESDVFIVTKRAALNMAYQLLSRIPQNPACLLEIKGQDLIGLPLVTPLAQHSVVYVLPMMNVKTDKGTGVVTSVPSDSPDDYMALSDLKSKPALRAKYGVKDEWVLPFDVIPIIHIPEFGNKSAETVCEKMKIKSQNDREKLEEAKKMTYLKGFTDGKMLVGEYEEMKVQEAKPLIRKKLLESGQAVLYSEPEKKVISRSGDECVVALTDQWYLVYGESEWKSLAEKCLSKMELYSDETRTRFEHTLGWLNQWACSRSFGLGTKIPWDPAYLIESLSDSTVYMAYYTVAHILQEGDLYGTDAHPVKPEEMTFEVWEYVFGGSGELPKSSIPIDTLKRMRREFEYWYPFDLRVSGKDLIQNHLTFSIYNHVTMFPEDKWPRSVRCNGFLMLNSEKMSKSTGNFLTLSEAIEEFSADATRFALADAGDTLDDANFLSATANAAILRLTKELSWMEDDVKKGESGMRQGGGGSYTFADRVFENEINIAVHLTEQNYKCMMFREVMKSGFFDLQNAKDEYRLSCTSGGVSMDKDLVFRFMEVQTKLITPICPHYGEYVHSQILERKGFAVESGWPIAAPPNLILQRANKFLQTKIVEFRKCREKYVAKLKKAKKEEEGLRIVGVILVAEKYDGWKEECLKVLQRCFDNEKRCFDRDSEILSELLRIGVGGGGDMKQVQKKCMPFIKFKKDEALSVGGDALEVKLAFDEIGVFKENVDLIKKQVEVDEIRIELYSHSSSLNSPSQPSSPSPGDPTFVFVHS